MQFGFDGSGRWTGRRRSGAGFGLGGEDLAANRELLPLSALNAEAAAAGQIANTPSGAVRAQRLLAYAGLLREIARRDGRVEMLARASAAANRAQREAGVDRALQCAALTELALIQRQGFVLYGDREAADQAAAFAEEALSLAPGPLASAPLQGLKAQLLGALALAAGDRAGALEAAAALEVAHKIALSAAPADADAIATDRAELMLSLGLVQADRRLLAEAEGVLAVLAEQTDPDLSPLTYARVYTSWGQALVALGDVLGEPASIAEGVAALKAAVAALPPGHSPLDTAHAGHALGLALQSMGEACEEEVLFDRAVQAFSPALEALDCTPNLPYRAVVAHDGAVCLARRAERRGDLAALEQAELAFRQALKTRNANADPLAWAVTQMALARIYEAQSALRPDRGERVDAAFALASALDVFTERGQRSLADAALSALDRLKERV